MNLLYILLRLVRHFQPERLTRFLLRRGLIIRPGLETREPAAAVARYVDALQARGFSLKGRQVLVFGYGGNYAVGAELLQAGAGHVLLLDRFAPPDDRRNRALLQTYPNYFRLQDGRVETMGEYLAVMHEDVKKIHIGRKYDLVLSSSVYEHLDDVEGITAALAGITAADGMQVHYVDLRDHYFKLPFEMLRFSERAWKNWLNPTSNLNRYRLRDYREVFGRHFDEVSVNILAREPDAFEHARRGIRPEFLTGDDAQDDVTLIEVTARRPK